MGSSLLNIVNNLSEGILKIKSKYGHNYKNCEFCKIKYKFINKSFMKNLRNDFETHADFLNMTAISLFYCYEKVSGMNVWMIGKSSMKSHYLKKKIFIVT